MVAVTGAFPLLTAVNDGILPVPLAASPIDGSLLVQLYTVFGRLPEKLIAAVEAPSHSDWLTG